MAVSRFRSIAAWTLFLAVPTGAGLVRGLPLGPIELVAIACAWWLAWRQGRIAGSGLIAALLVVKIAAALIAPMPGGLRARYYANAEWRPPVERSVEFRSDTFTRIDRVIDFAPDARTLPLGFFNDIERFNFYQPNQPDRATLPFSVIWDGYWWADDDGEHRFYVDAPGAAAQLTIDGWPAASVPEDAGSAQQPARFRRGWRRVELRLASPAGAPRRISAGEWIGNRKTPFGRGPFVATDRTPGWRVSASRARESVATVFDLLALAWLAVLLARAVAAELQSLRGSALSARRERVLALLCLVAIAEAWWFASPWAHRLMLLGGGGDPMTYEFDARDIVLNGPLMTVHAPLGQGEAFYYQPLYAYFLALMHWLSGEGMFGIVFVQRLLGAAVVWTLTGAAAMLGGDAVWLAAFVGTAAFAYVKVGPLADVLLSESLFLPLLAIWLLAEIRALVMPSARRAGWLGAITGLTTLARSTTIAGWPILMETGRRAWRADRHRSARLAGVFAIAIAIVSLATIRNWIVAHRFVPVTSSLPVNLWVGNEPPPSLKLDPFLEAHAAQYAPFGLELHTRIVIEYARQAPRLFVANLGRKALYALGWFEPLVPGRGFAPFLIAILVAAGVDVARGGRRPAVYYLPVLTAFTQFLVVVAFFPHVYGDRLILPMYLLLLPNAALGVNWIARRLAGMKVTELDEPCSSS